MFFKYNVKSCNRIFPSVTVLSLRRTKYPLLWWIQQIPKVTANVLKKPPKNIIDHTLTREWIADAQWSSWWNLLTVLAILWKVIWPTYRKLKVP